MFSIANIKERATRYNLEEMENTFYIYLQKFVEMMQRQNNDDQHTPRTSLKLYHQQRCKAFTT